MGFTSNTSKSSLTDDNVQVYCFFTNNNNNYTHKCIWCCWWWPQYRWDVGNVETWKTHVWSASAVALHAGSMEFRTSAVTASSLVRSECATHFSHYAMNGYCRLHIVEPDHSKAIGLKRCHLRRGTCYPHLDWRVQWLQINYRLAALHNQTFVKSSIS